MARSFLTDYLQTHAFWLIDGSTFTSGSFPVLAPTVGFSSVTAPEIQLETAQINEGNGLFSRTVVTRGSVGNLTLSRGVTLNQDFYFWTLAALAGTTAIDRRIVGGLTPRRTLLLIHFMSRGLTALTQQAARTVAGSEPVRQNVTENLVAGLAPAPFETLGRVPARAWILWDCLPVRYKSGSDFDASSGAISITELDLAVERITEVGLN